MVLKWEDLNLFSFLDSYKRVTYLIFGLLVEQQAEEVTTDLFMGLWNCDGHIVIICNEINSKNEKLIINNLIVSCIYRQLYSSQQWC